MNETRTDVAMPDWRDAVTATVAAAADDWYRKINVAINSAVLITGTALTEMKAAMPHGCFEQWWREELKLRDRKQVNDFMQAAAVLRDQPADTPLSNLPPRTLGILNRGGPEAVEKVVKQLEQGVRVTEAMARQIAKPNVANSPQMVEAKPANADEPVKAQTFYERVRSLEAAVREFGWSLKVENNVYEDHGLTAPTDFITFDVQIDPIPGSEPKDELQELRSEIGYMAAEIERLKADLAWTHREWDTTCEELEELRDRMGMEDDD